MSSSETPRATGFSWDLVAVICLAVVWLPGLISSYKLWKGSWSQQEVVHKELGWPPGLVEDEDPPHRLITLRDGTVKDLENFHLGREEIEVGDYVAKDAQSYKVRVIKKEGGRKPDSTGRDEGHAHPLATDRIASC